MTELRTVVTILVCGFALGAAFYGGLWWTVRRIPSRAPGLWLLGSFVVRTGLVLSGFLAVTRGDWRGLLACLLGFCAGRVGVMRFTRSGRARGGHIVIGASS